MAVTVSAGLRSIRPARISDGRRGWQASRSADHRGNERRTLKTGLEHRGVEIAVAGDAGDRREERNRKKAPGARHGVVDCRRAAFWVPSSNRTRAARLLALIAEMLTRLHVMPDHAADIAQGKESGRRWAREQAQRSEIDQLRYMYKQQAPSEAGEQMSHWDRCLTIADEIGSTAATKWQTLWSGDWRERRDRFWRAGFVEAALEVRGKRNNKPKAERP
jgi:hypothetical protein